MLLHMVFATVLTERRSLPWREEAFLDSLLEDILDNMGYARIFRVNFSKNSGKMNSNGVCDIFWGKVSSSS